MTTTTKNNFKNLIDDIKKDSDAWRPVGFTSLQSALELHMQGKSSTRIKAKIKESFPMSWKYIDAIPYPLLEHVATELSSFYSESPERTLSKEGAEVSDDIKKEFDVIVQRSKALEVLREMERNVVAGINVVIAARVRESFSGTEKSKCVRFEAHSIRDVHIVPDSRQPADLQSALAIMIESHTEGRKKAYEVWTRNPDGIGFIVDVLASDGSVISSEQVNIRRYPFVLFTSKSPTNMPYHDGGSDNLDVIESQIVDMCDEKHLARMQAHEDTVVKTNRDIPNVHGGPDNVIKMDPSDSVETITRNPKFEAVRALNRESLKTIAVLNGLPLHTVSIDGTSAPESGVARSISERSLTRRRQALASMFAEKEREELWPIVFELSHVFVDGASDLQSYSVFTSPKSDSEFMSLESKQAILQADVDNGVLTKAEYAVRMGYYKTVQEAEAAGVSNVLTESLTDGLLPPVKDEESVDEVQTSTDAAPQQSNATVSQGGKQQEAFTGIQIEKGTELALKVRDGLLDKETASLLFSAFFPTVDASIRESIFASITVKPVVVVTNGNT